MARRPGEAARAAPVARAMAAVAATTGMQQEVATTATLERAMAVTATTTSVGPLPQPSLNSNSGGSSLLSFFKMTFRVCGGSLPFL